MSFRDKISKEANDEDRLFYMILAFIVMMGIGVFIFLNKSGYFDKVYLERKSKLEIENRLVAKTPQL